MGYSHPGNSYGYQDKRGCRKGSLELIESKEDSKGQERLWRVTSGEKGESLWEALEGRG